MVIGMLNSEASRVVERGGPHPSPDTKFAILVQIYITYPVILIMIQYYFSNCRDAAES